MELFRLFGSIFVDNEKANQSIADTDSKAQGLAGTLEKASGKATEFGKKLTSAGTNMVTKVTAPLVGLGIAVGKTGSDFEAAMSEVQAISGATGADLATLEAKAKEMGSTTKFSASQSAEALKYMAMAGWDSQKMLDGLSGVMNLAAAAGEELGVVSDIVTDAMTAFGMEASRANEFADVLAATSSKANTNVSMLGESFKYVAPVAGALGYSAQDTAIALGLMANAGIKGSQSGTALRATISRLVKPTKESGDSMSELGISMLDSEGKMKSLGEIMGDLRTAFKDLEPDQQAFHAAQLAGQEAMSGLLAIVNAGEEDFDKLSNAIYNADGTAQQMAETMQDNLQGRITALKSSLEGVAIQLYDKLQPAFETVTEHIQKAVDWFAKLDPEVQTTILIIAGLAAAIGPLLIVLGLMAQGVGAIIGLLPVLGTAFTVLTGPVGLVVAAIAALIAIGVRLYKNWDEIKAKASEIWGSLKGIVADAITAVKTKISDMIQVGKDFVAGLWEGISSSAAEMVRNIKNWFSDNIIGVAKKILGIASPSKEGESIGLYFTKGLALGMGSGKGEVITQSQALAEAMTSIRTQIEDLNKQYAVAVVAQGANSEAAEQLKTRIADLTVQYENLANAVGKVSEKQGKISNLDLAGSATSKTADYIGSVLKYTAETAGIDWSSVNEGYGVGIDIPSYDIGTPYVPEDQLAFVHKGEEIIPAGQKRAGIIFSRGAFEGAFILDDYGVDRLMDRIVGRLAGLGVRV